MIPTIHRITTEQDPLSRWRERCGSGDGWQAKHITVAGLADALDLTKRCRSPKSAAAILSASIRRTPGRRWQRIFGMNTALRWLREEMERE